MDRKEAIHNYVAGSLGRAARCDTEMVEELETHLADLLVQNLAKGMNEPSAWSASVAALGDLGALRRRILWSSLRRIMLSPRALTAFAAFLCLGAGCLLPIVVWCGGFVGGAIRILDVWPIAAWVTATFAATLLHLLWPNRVLRIAGSLIASGLLLLLILTVRSGHGVDVLWPVYGSLLAGLSLCLLSFWLPQGCAKRISRTLKHEAA